MASPEAIGAAILRIKEAMPQDIPYGWGTDDTFHVWDKELSGVSDESLAFVVDRIIDGETSLRLGTIKRIAEERDKMKSKRIIPESHQIENPPLTDDEVEETLNKLAPDMREMLKKLKPGGEG